MDREMGALVKRVVEVFLTLSPKQIFATFALFERITPFSDPSADLKSLLELEM